MRISNKIVFIIIPNNSGSTIVHNAISKAENVASLKEGSFTEGEKVVGMNYDSHSTPMPVPFLYEPRWSGKDITNPVPGLGRIWGAKYTDLFRDESRFDWSIIKDIWMKNWQKHQNYSTDAVLIEKSPTSLAWVHGVGVK